MSGEGGGPNICFRARNSHQDSLYFFALWNSTIKSGQIIWRNVWEFCIAPLGQTTKLILLGGRFGYFLFFFLLGNGEIGGPRLREGGGRFFIESTRRGGGSPGREGPRGREGVCGELRNFLGGGLNNFLGGVKCPPSFVIIT